MVEKSFLIQRFAKLKIDDLHIIGYSVAGEETVVQIPELNVCFDIGRAPYFSLTSNIVCVSHGHMDHVAGLAYYLSQRSFQGMANATILLPEELCRPVDAMLKCWRIIERQETPYELVPMAPGETYKVRKDLLIRALENHHGGTSLGYAVISVRDKLKQEYMGIPGPELAAMRKKGVAIQYRTEVPLATYLGDTAIGPVFDHPDVRNARILLTECTFFDPDHRSRAKVGKHLHVDHLIPLLEKLANQELVITHVSRRTGIRRAKRILRRAIDPERMEHIHFLMDFEGASDAGEMEDAGAPAPDAPE